MLILEDVHRTKTCLVSKHRNTYAAFFIYPGVINFGRKGNLVSPSAESNPRVSIVTVGALKGKFCGKDSVKWNVPFL
jgi:hypothetical protein